MSSLLTTPERLRDWELDSQLDVMDKRNNVQPLDNPIEDPLHFLSCPSFYEGVTCKCFGEKRNDNENGGPKCNSYHHDKDKIKTRRTRRSSNRHDKTESSHSQGSQKRSRQHGTFDMDYPGLTFKELSTLEWLYPIFKPRKDDFELTELAELAKISDVEKIRIWDHIRRVAFSKEGKYKRFRQYDSNEEH